MNKNIKAILGIFAATIVISVIEFLRNESLLSKINSINDLGRDKSMS